MTYEALHSMLKRIAAHRGSKDPENAATKAVLGVLANPAAHAAFLYWFEGAPLDEDMRAEWSFPHLLAWFRRHVVWIVLNERRLVASKNEVSMSDGSIADPVDPAPDPEFLAVDAELLAQARECLSTLRSDFQDVVNLYTQGFTYREIAKILQRPVNNIGPWIKRAVEAIRKCMEAKGIDFSNSGGR